MDLPAEDSDQSDKANQCPSCRLRVQTHAGERWIARKRATSEKIQNPKSVRCLSAYIVCGRSPATLCSSAGGGGSGPNVTVAWTLSRPKRVLRADKPNPSKI